MDAVSPINAPQLSLSYSKFRFHAVTEKETLHQTVTMWPLIVPITQRLVVESLVSA